MRRILLILCLFATFSVTNSFVNAQAPTPVARLYGASPFQDSLWVLDTANYSVIQRYAPSLAGFTITGITGLTFDPTTYEAYVIMKLSGVTGRVLGKIDLPTGVCTQVGNLGTNFSTIAFREDGQLFGVTGDGASPGETMYLIDKTNGTTTLATTLGNGADGEVLCYNRADNLFYHWSGNGTVVFESVMSAAPYTVTNIPTTGTAGGETFGALYINPTTMLRSTISSNFNRISSTGTYTATFGSNPDDLRGLAMPPQFTNSGTTLCDGETLNIKAGSLQLFDSIVCHWGDGSSDIVNVSGIADFNHVYASAGSYTVHIELDNGSVRDTVPTTFNITVNPSPAVTLSGNTSICSGDSVTVTSNGETTMQWYMNGAMIAGETDTTYSTNVAGVYNMYATNSFGCSDSAAVGITLVNFTNPIVDLGNDTTGCEQIVLDAQNSGATYAWNTGANAQTETVTASGPIIVDVTDGNGCSASDTVQVTINNAATFSLGADASVCGADTLAPNPQVSGTYLWSDNSNGSDLIVTSSGTYDLTVTDANGCPYTSSVTITVNTNPTVNLTSNASGTVCTYDADLTLTGTPAGGTFSGPSVSGNSFDPSIGVGSYTLNYDYTDGNGCSGSDALTIDVDGCASVEENSLSFNIFPNPSTGVFAIETVATNLQITIVDITGKQVPFTQSAQNGLVKIDLSAQQSGAYFIRLTDGTGATSVAKVLLDK